MRATSLYPVLMTTDVAATAAFYQRHLEFEIMFESAWYVSLRLGSWELAILDASHPTIPAGFRNSPTSGILLNVEVEDVDALYERLLAEGLEPVLPLRSEPFGQRHAIFAGPGGVLIDVITPIPPTEEYADQFAPAALDEARGVAS
jgi:uncharacterized glyoxalase superfamily protein PhnB